ncbi:essential MCU regulator [Nomia melanderi]|uniref:essential MCU regulator n=1 Tax=Nomia melanderi TaxID=2448451 RepID=UPI0013043A7B|nr:essential MCU regulator, mitochondrial [Nomia melanderi]XP_031825403.1 essential MCU regulator, mitochondrial [Nomia melanderi]XP_031825404.1 essential MCU regulator, mitochondrial [Nomia melanderi]
MLQRASFIFRNIGTYKRIETESRLHFQSRITTPSGAILPEPKGTPFGYVNVISSVGTGLIIGVTLSKLVAYVLEEKELFIPSDDDDDD